MKVSQFLAALSCFTVSLGISSNAHAASSTGAIDFSVPKSASPANPLAFLASPEAVQPPDPAENSLSETPPPSPDAIALAPNSPPPPILDFPPLPPSPSSSSSSPSPPLPPSPPSLSLFHGNSDSLVARTVGHAEGTRTPDGSKTRAYYGHSDPGNGVWNLGSFSFQHCREAQYQCSTPEEADAHQLQRLQGQAEKLRQRAEAVRITLTLLEELNGIDLANQAPLAALGQPGYMEWLKKAQEMGLKDEDAVLWARVKSYWDPDLDGWNAPGLGNREPQIEHDQHRRLKAIARALEVYTQQVAAGKLPHEPKLSHEPKPDREARSHPEKMADRIIFQNLSAE